MLWIGFVLTFQRHKPNHNYILTKIQKYPQVQLNELHSKEILKILLFLPHTFVKHFFRFCNI